MIWANIFEQAINKKIPTEERYFLKTSHLVDDSPNETFFNLVEEGLIINKV